MASTAEKRPYEEELLMLRRRRRRRRRRRVESGEWDRQVLGNPDSPKCPTNIWGCVYLDVLI